MDETKITYCDKRATLFLEDEIKKHLSDGCKKLGLTIDAILAHVTEDYESFSDFCQKYLLETASKLSPKVRAENAWTIRKFPGQVDTLWSLKNGLEFVVDYEKAINLPNVEDIANVNFDSISDCFISFTIIESGKRRYLPVYANLSKIPITAETQRYKDMTMYMLAIGVAREDRFRYQVHFSKELYPRIFNLNADDACGKCPAKNTMELKGLPQDQVCMLGKRQKEICHIYKNPFTPQDLIKIFTYIAEMFENRRSLIRKNSKKVKVYNNSPTIDLVCSEREGGAQKEVPLLLYTKGEGIEYIPKQGTKHGSHASPKEHVRHKHERHYKSGKVVIIEDTTISKGKEKVVYKI